MTGVLAVTAGTAALPAITPSGDPNTGIFSPGADQLAISTNGTGKLFISSSGDIGVGAAPSGSYKLEVKGGAIDSVAVFDSTNAAGPHLRFSTSGTDRHFLGSAPGFTSGGTSSDLAIRTAGYLALLTGGNNERARIRGDGTFEIKGAGTAGSSPAVSVNPSAPTDSLFITSGGLMGLGTGSPGYRLTVKAANDDGIALTRPSSAASYHLLISTTETGGDQYTTKFNTFNNDLILNTFATGGSGGTIRFRTGTAVNPTDKMVLDSSGRLGIGTTGPTAPLSFSTAVGQKIDLYSDPIPGNEFGFGLQSSELRICAGASSFIGFRTGGYSGSERARIDSSGRLLVGTATQVGNANGGILQLGSGITFPATAVAASDANTLDDYEEGTWTPAYTGFTTNSGTLTAVASYIKIGLMVMYQWQQTGGNISTSAGAYMTGLPFGFGAGGLTYGGGAAGDSGPNSSIVSFYQGSIAQFASFPTAMNNMTGLSWSGTTRLTP